MKRQLLTDIELRAHWSRTRSGTYCLEEGAMLTPAAKDFVREHDITLCYVSPEGAPPVKERRSASGTVVPMGAPEPLYSGNPSVWNRAARPDKPDPAIPAAPLYAGNPTVWNRSGTEGLPFPALPTATDYAGNPAVWDRARIAALKPPAPKAAEPAPASVPSQPQAADEGMTTVPIPEKGGKARYRIAATGEEIEEKPEEMTHLRGNLLVPKTDARIVFRGKLDSLMAFILECQLQAQEDGEPALLEDLGGLLDYTRRLLGAEVKEEPLPPFALLGMTSNELRDVSHHIKREFGINHPIPDYTMGRLCVRLNSLRTLVRETELAAAQAFDLGGKCSRTDIVEGLNRLSSAVYILFCRKVSGYYQ